MDNKPTNVVGEIKIMKLLKKTFAGGLKQSEEVIEVSEEEAEALQNSDNLDIFYSVYNVVGEKGNSK